MLRKLWERNLSVIPVCGKRPIIANWSIYSERLPTEQEIDLWESKYPYSGIGLVCGAASNIMCIDIDVDDAELKRICPQSNVVKVGRQGKETRFFQYNKNISLKHLDGVDILSDKSQTVIPPSIHPDTKKPYFYSTLDTLENTPAEDLPVIDEKDVNAIKDFLNKKSPPHNQTSAINLVGKFIHEDNTRCPHGSQARLKALCAALIEQRKTPNECVDELLKYDQQHHLPVGYFSDKTRSDCKADRFTNALNFYSSIYKTINTKRIRDGLEPQTPIEVKTVNVSDLIKPKEIKHKFPESQGLIYTIQKMILGVSRSNQEEMALGSALAICSTMASNRFHIEGRPAITHQYIMNVARSGLGKGAGFYVANKLFGPSYLERYNLLGIRNYSSVAAFVQNLPIQRSRLDMIDEFGTVVEAFTNGSQIAKELESLLTELYTDRGDYWRGHFTKTNGNTGGCYAPAVTICANIQEAILVEAAKKSMIESGLLGRFLFFSGDTNADFNENYNTNLDVTDLSRECERLFPYHSLEGVLPDGTIITDPGKIEPIREPLIMDSSVKKYRKDLDRDLFEREKDLERQDDTTGAVFLSRFLQIAERIAITNAVCCDRREITRDDLDYGLSLVMASSARSSDYLRSIGATRNEKKQKWLTKHLRKHGFVSHSKLLKNSHLSSREFKDLIDTMLQSGVIIEFKDASTGLRHYKIP